MSADKDFIDGFYRPMWPDLYELRKEAEREYIPIIRRDTEMFLNTVLALIRPKTFKNSHVPYRFKWII